MSPCIILIETSTSLCSTALLEGDRITAVRKSTEPRAHAALTAPFVKEMLDERGLKVSDCDAVCLSMGPGSYTGLRVGSSTAKGLCWGLNRPAIGVSTLAAMAQLGRGTAGERVICCAMDARRAQIYNALFEEKDGALRRLCPDRAVAAGELAAGLLSLEREVWVLGDGWEVCAGALAAAGVPHTVAPEAIRYQSAWGVALEALDKPALGAEELLPIYLRLSQAERERQSKMV